MLKLTSQQTKALSVCGQSSGVLHGLEGRGGVKGEARAAVDVHMGRGGAGNVGGFVADEDTVDGRQMLVAMT